ncbi:MAG: GspH/FimT family pseudopilin [Pseudomonadota bacterium]
MFKKQNGFTLIELMVALTVMGVAIAIGIPSFNKQIMNNQSVALGEDFVSALNLARVTAVTGRKGATQTLQPRASICASVDGATCSGAAGGWSQGFIAFVDMATSDSAAAPIVGTVLQVWPRRGNRADITVRLNGSDISFVRFTSVGTLARINNVNFPVIVNAEMRKCSGNAGRTITVGLSGLLSVVRKVCVVY